MRLSSMVAIAAACLLTLAACSDDGDSEGKSDQDGTPSASSAEPGGEGVMEFEDSERKLPPDQVCRALDAAEVSEVLGDRVKRGPVVQRNCTFADPRSESERSVSISYLLLSAVGGLDAFEQGLGGGAEEVPNVGDRAFVVVSEGVDGAQAVAAIATGEALIQLQVVPGAGVSVGDARTVAENLLRLVDARV